MSLVKLMTAAALATTLTLVMVTGVSAETKQEQELSTKSEVKVECTTGAYGQSSNCTAEAKAEANGKQTQILGDAVVCRADGKCFRTHRVTDTGLDLPTMAVAAGTIVTGAGAALIQLKSKLS